MFFTMARRRVMIPTLLLALGSTALSLALTTKAAMAAPVGRSRVLATATTTGPALSITSSLLVSGRTSAVYATLSHVPSGENVRITFDVTAGLTCSGARWVAAGTARAQCAFRPSAPGAFTLRATGTRMVGRRPVGTSATSARVTAEGVAALVPEVVRRGQAATIRFIVAAPRWAPAATVRLAPGIAGATGCPATINGRLSVQHTFTAICQVTPQPVRAMVAATEVRSGSAGHLTAARVSRAVADAPRDSADDSARTWDQESKMLWAMAQQLTAGSHDAAATGFEIIVRAHQQGWADPEVKALVDHLLALRKSDGGWGLEVAWDAFQDGTTNPSSTTYTVSTAAHAGPALLGAWQHQLVSDADLRAAVDSILQTPRVAVPGGTCIAYSRSGFDSACVPNVSLGAAAWLKQVREATGWSIPELDDLVATTTAADHYLFHADSGYWSYSDVPSQLDRIQDPPHQGYTLESALVLDPDFGKAVTVQFLSAPWWAQPGVGSLGSYGLGLSQVVINDCQGAARSPSLLEAFSAIQDYPTDQMTRFLALQGTLYGFRALGACFDGEVW